MSGYRFCRSDDVSALVDAHNVCCRPHDPGLPPLTVDDFRRDTRELHLWASSCMLAFQGKEAVGVLLGAKRETESWIHSIAVHPDHLRQGHGAHMLTSLSQKLAILGPPRIVAEVPADSIAAVALFESCGYRRERVFADMVRDPALVPEAPVEAVIPVTVDELLDGGAIGAGRAWERAAETLQARKDDLHGLALGFGDRFEAWMLYRDPVGDEPREIHGFGCADPKRAEALLGILIAAADPTRAMLLRRVSEAEVGLETLTGLGFREFGRTIGYAIDAS